MMGTDLTCGAVCYTGGMKGGWLAGVMVIPWYVGGMHGL